jgi:ATP-dependent phosphoenolpyruvate carboxykinase
VQDFARALHAGLATSTEACRLAGIDTLGITKPSTVFHNLDHDVLFAHEVANSEGVICKTKYGEVFAVNTGKFTGRSPKDKWFVKNVGSESDQNLWWGKINQPTSPEVFEELLAEAVAHFNTLDKCYVFDGYCGASLNSQKKERFGLARLIASINQSAACAC